MTMLHVDLIEEETPIQDQINRARRNILVHSVLYYTMDETVISDYDYDFWGQRLIFLQNAFPDVSAQTPFMRKEFENFSGTSSGFDLPLKDPWAVRTAHWLLERREGSQPLQGL